MRLDDAVSLWDVHYILKSRGECWLSRSAVDKLKKWPERASFTACRSAVTADRGLR